MSDTTPTPIPTASPTPTPMPSPTASPPQSPAQSPASGPQQGNQTQYSHLTGKWTFAFTYTASGLHLYELQTRWGATVDVLSDPQFQWTPPTGISPAQYAL